MEITEERHGDVVVLRCSGDDAEGWEILGERIQNVTSGEAPVFVLDFSGLRATDPSPVASALSAFIALKDRQGRMAVVRGDSAVWKQFLGMDIMQRLTLCETLDDALESLSTQGRDAGDFRE